MKTFLQNLEDELKKNNLNEEEINDIIADHSEMIESAISEGLSDEDLEQKFGNPKDLADELSQFTEKDNKKGTKKEKKTFEFAEVSEHYNVEITLVNDDVLFESNNDNKIVVTYSGRVNIKEYDIKFEHNTLIIKAPKTRGIFSVFGRNGTKYEFIISLPSGIIMDSFKMKNVNGDVEISSIDSNDFTIGLNNGDIHIKNLKSGITKISTINGDIDIEQAVCKEFAISQISGDSKIDQLIVKKDIFVNTVSGDISILNSECNEAGLKTVSGDLTAKEFYPKSLSLASVSGDIKIQNSNPDKHIEIKHKKSVSGDISIITK